MILAAGTKGERYSMKSARMILAQPLGGLSGTSVEVKLQALELNRNAKGAPIGVHREIHRAGLRGVEGFDDQRYVLWRKRGD